MPAKKAPAKSPLTAVKGIVTDGPPVGTIEVPSPANAVAIDYSSFLAAEDAETEGLIDAVLVIPNFRMTEKGTIVLADDQSTATEVRLCPQLTSAALHVLASFRYGVSLVAAPQMLAALIHPDDMNVYERRLTDGSNPVPLNWFVLAFRGVLAKYGLEMQEPGKSG